MITPTKAGIAMPLLEDGRHFAVYYVARGGVEVTSVLIWALSALQAAEAMVAMAAPVEILGVVEESTLLKVTREIIATAVPACADAGS